MIPIKQFLNKIKYSNKFKKENITVHYFDRIENKLIPLQYKSIKIDKDFLMTEGKVIPLHRIREIRNNNILIWKRSWQDTR